MIKRDADGKPIIDEGKRLLADEAKGNLGALDLFDRVINLKLTTANGDEYVVRSDYETYYPEMMKAVSENKAESLASLNKCYIRKCQYKPSIKVQYKRVSFSTPIAIDIFVNNFFMLDKSGKMLKSFSNISNPLYKVELAMGYFGQFKRAMQKGEASAIPVEALFDFDHNKLKGHGITVITMCNVEYVQTDKLPPDMTVHIHGYVGNLYVSDLESLGEDVAKNYDEIMSKNKAIQFETTTNEQQTLLGTVFYECVTKNWLRGKDKVPDDILKNLLHPDQPANMTLRKSLNDKQAKRYGVRVFFSVGAEDYAREYDKVNNIQNNKQEAFKKIVVTIRKASNALAKVNAIKNALKLDDFCATPIPFTGDILIYRSKEISSAEDMLTGTPLGKEYENDAVAVYWDNKLPAVYNITTDALCTISCPFFFFLNPFQRFFFKSAYALGGLVSYHANFTASEDTFYALWQTVTFATVENVNECTIICTGSRRGQNG